MKEEQRIDHSERTGNKPHESLSDNRKEPTLCNFSMVMDKLDNSKNCEHSADITNVHTFNTLSQQCSLKEVPLEVVEIDMPQMCLISQRFSCSNYS